MASKHRITVGEELRFDADIQGLKNATGTYAQRAGGTSASAAPLPFFNVRDYGAVGDGVADDSAAITAAIAAAGINGMVRFPKGIYRAHNLTPLSGQTWCGGGTVVRPASSSLSVVAGADLTGFTLDGLTIDGNRSSPAVRNSTILLIRAIRCIVRNCTIQNVPTNNIACEIRGGVQSSITGNRFYNVGIGAQVGLTSGSTDACVANRITENVFDTVDFNPIFVTENAWSDVVSVGYRISGMIIQGNTLRNWSDAGIESGSGCVGTVVSGNVLEGSSTGNDGILVRDNQNALIANNSIRGLSKATARGISVVNLNDTSDRIRINGNSITGCGLNGIQVPVQTAGVSNVDVSGNTVELCGDAGISISKVAGLALAGNTSRQNGKEGAYLFQVTKASVTGGRYVDNGNAGGTYAGVLVTDVSSEVAVTGVVASDTRASGKTQSYGVQINGNVTNFSVVGNMLNGNNVAAYQGQSGTTGKFLLNAGADLASDASFTAMFAPRAGSGLTGRDVQLPTTQTKTVAGLSVAMLQNNDAAAPDSGTRVYIVPRGTPSTGVASVLKLFADDYSVNQTDYRDFGIYFSKDQNGDSGTRSNGVFWFNGKVNGTYAGTSPDIGFSMQDGQYVAGRVALATVNGTTPNIQWVFGPSVPRIGTKVAVAAEIQGDLGFGTAADSAIRWQRTDGSTTDNALALQRVSGGGNVKVTLGSTQRLLLNNAGSLVLGNGSSALSTASTDGFLYLNSTAGTPTGTPTTQGAAVPVVLDTTASKLWAYIGGAWKSVTFA